MNTLSHSPKLESLDTLQAQINEQLYWVSASLEERKAQAYQQILYYCEQLGGSNDPIARETFRQQARKWKAEWDMLQTTA